MDRLKPAKSEPDWAIQPPVPPRRGRPPKPRDVRPAADEEEPSETRPAANEEAPALTRPEPAAAATYVRAGHEKWKIGEATGKVHSHELLVNMPATTD